MSHCPVKGWTPCHPVKTLSGNFICTYSWEMTLCFAVVIDEAADLTSCNLEFDVDRLSF